MISSVLPNAQPWLVKCAILSSATSRPLRRPNVAELPYTHLTERQALPGGTVYVIPYPNQDPLTVYGMVQASEALAAAIHLNNRVMAAQTRGKPWPTRVQKRGFFGGWKNAPVLNQAVS